MLDISDRCHTRFDWQKPGPLAFTGQACATGAISASGTPPGSWRRGWGRGGWRGYRRHGDAIARPRSTALTLRTGACQTLAAGDMGRCAGPFRKTTALAGVCSSSTATFTAILPISTTILLYGHRVTVCRRTERNCADAAPLRVRTYLAAGMPTSSCSRAGCHLSIRHLLRLWHGLFTRMGVNRNACRQTTIAPQLNAAPQHATIMPTRMRQPGMGIPPPELAMPAARCLTLPSFPSNAPWDTRGQPCFNACRRAATPHALSHAPLSTLATHVEPGRDRRDLLVSAGGHLPSGKQRRLRATVWRHDVAW